MHGLVLGEGGDLLAGTHHGLFRIRDGRADRIGDRRDDLMGLTRSSTGHLLASGHPADGSAEDPLGLVVSRDDGRTWTARSEVGRSDFHSLAERDGRVAGSVSGRLATSDDGGHSWTMLDDDAHGLAMDDRHLWITTPRGLVRGRHDGSELSPVADAPTLVVIAAGTDGALWGTDADGAAWIGRDRTWERVDAIGGAVAVVAVNRDLAYFAQDDSLITVRRR